MALEIKIIKREETGKLRQLFDNTPYLAPFNPFKNGSVEEFIWQFFSDSFQPSIYTVAFDNETNEIIGTLSALFIQMKSPEGVICRTIKPEDTLINIKGLIKYKNRDILKEMLETIENESKSAGTKFFWGFTYSVNSFERLGFKRIFSSKQGVFVINSRIAYNHLTSLNESNGTKQKILIGGLSVLAFLRRGFLTRRFNKISTKEIGLKEVDENLLLSFLPPDLYCIYPDKSFLIWRIGNNPSSLKYSFLQFTDINGRIISYLIFSKKQERIFFIEQIFFEKNLTKKEKITIVNGALSYLEGKNAAIIRMMGFDHNYLNFSELEIFGKAGFIFLNKGIPFIFKSNDNSIDAGKVYLSRLNTQGVF